MKKLFLAVLVVAIAGLLAFSKIEDNRGIAKVSILQGVEVYIMSDPLRDFIIVDRINDFAFTFKGCEIENLVTIFVNKAHRKKLDFDAILIDGNSRATLIKFKD